MFQTDFSIEELRDRRNALCQHIGSAHALVVSAPAPNDRAPFRQYNDFYYLCGVEVPQSYLLIDGKSGYTTLFLPAGNEQSHESDEVLFSTDDSEAARKAAGVDAVRGREELTKSLEEVSELYTFLRDGEGLKCDERSLIDAQRQIKADPWDGRPDRGTHFVNLFKAKFPHVPVKDIAPILLKMRLVKSPAEIALCREAGRLSAEALRDAMRATRPGVMEYQLAALMQYRYLDGGARDNSYAPIVANGDNIFCPHYCDNNCVLEDGNLVLADCAPDYRYYTSDITRMWPVNGTYTPAQRALYGFVTEYHKALIAGIRPGRTSDDVDAEAAAIMLKRLDEFDFASPTHRAAAVTMCERENHICHSVGLSVHDGLGHKTGPLEAGMIFAVDPQLWLREEHIYIRVEDTVCVTDTGVEVFTSDITLDLDEIESIVRGQ